MPYVELEQFLDRGAIRAWWGFSWKTFLGLGIGAVLGQQLGAVVYGSGTAGMAALTAVGALLGQQFSLWFFIDQGQRTGYSAALVVLCSWRQYGRSSGL